MQTLKSIQFGRIMTWLKKTVVVKVPMLGGKSYFFAKYENPVSIMTIGKDGDFYYIDKILWKQVCERMDSLSEEERLKSSNYSMTKGWKNPNHILAPDVPALCKAYIEKK